MGSVLLLIAGILGNRHGLAQLEEEKTQDQLTFENAKRGLVNLYTKTHKNFSWSATSPQGFTMVEMLIVATLVGLLAVIAIPNYIRTRATAAKSACINNLRQIDAAVQQWAIEQGKTGSSSVNYGDISPYLRYSIVCPAGGTTFMDSYSLATVSSEALCVRVPLSHLLPASDVDVVSSTSGNPPAIHPPATPPGSGSGNGNGSSTRPGSPPGIGNPTPPPNAGNQGNGNGNGNGGGNGGGKGPGNGNANGNGNGAGAGNGNGKSSDAGAQSDGKGPGSTKGTIDGSEAKL